MPRLPIFSASGAVTEAAWSSRYDGIAIAAHWLLAVTIVCTFSVGLYMTDLPFSPSRLRLFNWHKWAGMTILMLSALRLAWRLTHRPPALPAAVLAAMPGWQRSAHSAVHALLYVLFFATPLSGWAYTSAAGVPVVWFGVLPLPDFVPVDKALAETLKSLHHALAFAVGALALLHAAAALKHHYVDRDGLLARMWFGRRTW